MQPAENQENGRRRSRTLSLLILTAIIVFFVAVPVYGVIRDLGMGNTVFVLDSSMHVSANPTETTPGLFERIHDFIFPRKNVSVPVIKYIDLEGRVVYTDKTPYVGGKIELRSDPRYTTTDGNGYFTFHDVEEGRHTISVLDENGTILAQATILIERVPGNETTTIERLPDGTYVFKVSVNIKMLEITLTLKRGDGDVAANGIDSIVIGADENEETSPEPAVPTETSNPPEDTTTPTNDGGNGGSGGNGSGSGSGGGGGGYTNQFNFNVYDTKTYYGTDEAASINIFGDTKRIAPGMKGSYRFTVDNRNNDFNAQYVVNFIAYDSLPEGIKIPMRFKLKADDVYIAGDDEKWCALDELNHGSTLQKGRYITYTLYWYWQESENDNNYTKYAGYPYSLAIKVSAEGK